MGIIIKPAVEAQLKETFINTLKDEVKLVVFTQELECQFCRENRMLAEELAALSPLLKLEVYNFINDKDKVNEYGIEMVPAIAVIGKKDFGIRFYGIPGGYEFTSLLETIKMVSTGETGLDVNSQNELKKITKPTTIKVFVTLTCPYCSSAVIAANKLAFLNDNIKSQMIEASEFIPLSNKYKVYAVPKTVINDNISFEGALPEASLIEQVIKANY